MKAFAPGNPAPLPLAFAIGCAEATAAVALEQDFAWIEATSVGGGNGGTRLTGRSSFRIELLLMDPDVAHHDWIWADS